MLSSIGCRFSVCSVCSWESPRRPSALWDSLAIGVGIFVQEPCGPTRSIFFKMHVARKESSKEKKELFRILRSKERSTTF